MPDEPSLPVIVERLTRVQQDVTDIRQHMATRDDQSHIDERIRTLTGALAAERAERVAAVEAEKAERVAADNKIAERLQLVEDRQEKRRYDAAIAIVLAVFGVALNVLAGPLRTWFGG